MNLKINLVEPLRTEERAVLVQSTEKYTPVRISISCGAQCSRADALLAPEMAELDFHMSTLDLRHGLQFAMRPCGRAPLLCPLPGPRNLDILCSPLFNPAQFSPSPARPRMHLSSGRNLESNSPAFTRLCSSKRNDHAHSVSE